MRRRVIAADVGRSLLKYTSANRTVYDQPVSLSSAKARQTFTSSAAGLVAEVEVAQRRRADGEVLRCCLHGRSRLVASG